MQHFPILPLSFTVGNGRRIKFWKDKWCGDELLCVLFPSLFALASCKEAWVADLWMYSNKKGVWIPNFSRPLNEWDIETVECFFSRLQDKAVDVEGEDKMFWVATKSESFSIKSLYSILEAGKVEPFPSSVVWNAWVPPKVSFFCLGDFVWKSFDFRPTTKEGLVFSQKMLPLLCS